MKYAVFVPDGACDYPIDELGKKTPLEAAKIPNMNFIAAEGKVGITNTIPKGFAPASDVANLSILGYNPRRYYTGRGPLEAANMGIDVKDDEAVFRCNLVTIDGIGEGRTMADYSAGHISERESKPLMELIDKELGSDKVKFYHGKSYRNLVIFKVRSPDEIKFLMKTVCMPPHDIIGDSISKHLPSGKAA